MSKDTSSLYCVADAFWLSLLSTNDGRACTNHLSIDEMFKIYTHFVWRCSIGQFGVVGILMKINKVERRVDSSMAFLFFS